MSLTRQLRDELSGVPSASEADHVAEISALLRFGGAWTVRCDGVGWVLETTAAAVLRRAHRALVERFGVRPVVEAHEPGGLTPRTRYRLRLRDLDCLAQLGLVDEEGQPQLNVPAWLLSGSDACNGYLRGALAAAGTLSGGGKAAHLEVRAPSARAAEDLRRVMERLEVTHTRVAAHGQSWRVVSKSGEDIGRVLALSGAHGTFLDFDEGRLRRQLRGEATRATNADRANLGRAVAASSRQMHTIEELLREGHWAHLPKDLQDTALARLANPHASLAELAGLLETTKATVHRRLVRLERDAESAPVRWVESRRRDRSMGGSAQADDDSGS